MTHAFPAFLALKPRRWWRTALLAALLVQPALSVEAQVVAGRAAPTVAARKQVLREALHLAPTADLRSFESIADPLGFAHEQYQLYYQGVKVEHGQVRVHSRGGKVESISGDAPAPAVGRSAQPGLSEAAALQRALTAIGARTYKWQISGEEAALKQQTGQPTATYRPHGELVWVGDFRQPEATRPLVLAWKFDIYAHEPVSRAHYFVDAQNGQIVLRDAIIKHVNAPGATFATRYVGTRTSTTDNYGSGYRLRQTTTSQGVTTLNLRKGNKFSSAVDFTDNDNNWTAAEHNNAAFDNAALDAHLGAQVTQDYWNTVHGRDSYDDKGSVLLSYVHYDETPSTSAGTDNAFWNGTAMLYGDGSTQYKPMTAIDVCGHEIGHAVCETTANLVYANESGALNEALSDIWGACIENHFDPTKEIWLIGEDITIAAGSALRSMSNPNQFGDPDTYKGTNWVASVANPNNSNDQGGVHSNSGVLNFWFYLLSQGGTGTNDKGTSYNVAGITIEKAARIAYRAERFYMSASTNYAGARIATMQAVLDLYGFGSAEAQAVAQAWHAVGLGDANGNTEPAPTITSFTPTNGLPGTSVTITGTNLSATFSVSFNGVAASVGTITSATSVTVTVPPTATTGLISLTTPSGTATTAIAFTITAAGPPPTINSFTPTAGQIQGGTVTITGTNLSGATGVSFNGAAATIGTNTATTITTTVPVGATSGALTVTTANGTATAPATAPASFLVLPTLSGFSPGSGVVGASVTFTGTTLTGALSVRFNGTYATSFTVNSATSITATVPTGAATGPVTVRTPSGTATSASSFTVMPSLTFDAFLPGQGDWGSLVSLRGRGFTGTTAIAFGAVSAPTFTVQSDGEIWVTVPTGAGTSTITITTPLGTVTSGGQFVARAPGAPVISAFSPASGAVGVGVTLTGTNFTGATAVRFNGTAAAFTVASATSITTTVPAGATTGLISVTNAVGTGFSDTPFALSSPPNDVCSTTVPLLTCGTAVYGSTLGATTTGDPQFSCNGISPTDNLNDGGGVFYRLVGTGERLQLSTCGFADFDTRLFLYTGTCGAYTCVTAANDGCGVTAGPTSLTFQSVAGTEYLVLVGGPGVLQGTTKGSFQLSLTCLTAPTITGFTPAGGDASTLVTITGTDFTGATAVTFGGAAAATFVVNSATQITATVGALAQSGPIRVTTPAGTATSATNFTVTPGAPTLLSFSPASGLPGASVTLTGANFSGATAVAFNGTAATFSVTNNASITTSVPAGATTGPISVTTPTGTATSATSFTVIPPPANDQCSGAIALSCGGSVSGSTVNSTNINDPTGSCGAASVNPAAGGVWYQMTGTGGVFTLTTLGGTTNYDTQLFVYGGTCGALTCVGGNDDFTGGGTASQVSFTSVAGTPYYVLVTGFVNPGTTGRGDFTLTATCTTPPTITSFAPPRGAAGTVVTITGTLLTGATAVTFGGVAASAFTVNSATEVVATVSAGAVSGPIQVVTPTGTAISATNFTVTVGAPTISSFSPTSGLSGASVTLTGTNFSGATAVAFNGTAATFSVTNNASITTSVPVGATTGPISVTTPSGTATSATAFTVLMPPANDQCAAAGSFPITCGQALNGTTINSTSTGDPTATCATISISAAAGGVFYSFVGNGNAVTLTTEGGQTGTLDTKLFVFSGTCGATVCVAANDDINPSNNFASRLTFDALIGTTYLVYVSGFNSAARGPFTLTASCVPLPVPTISSFNPTSGVAGTSVTATGTNFTGATAVTVNGVAVTPTAVTATSLQFVVPAGAGATQSITATSPNGVGPASTAFTVRLALTATDPATNGRNAPRAGSALGLTFSEPVTAASITTAASQVKVHSAQLGGRKPGTWTGGGTSSIAYTSSLSGSRADFRAGEVVSVTVPATVLSAGGLAVPKRVYQFTAATDGTGTGNFGAPATVPGGNGTNAVAVGDLNADGLPDLLWPNYNTTTVGVALATGPATYAAATSITVAGNPVLAPLADLDGDGDLDFVAVNYGNPAGTGSNLSIGLNSGSGTFAVSTLTTATGPRWAAPADLDGDGDLDLIVPVGTGVQIYANNGSGGVTLLNTVSGINFAIAAVAADVDNDGDLDLLTSNYFQSNTVSVRLNDGAGAFSGSQQVSVGTQPFHLAVGDVDGDGDLDLTTANQGAGTVSVRLNNGSGTFTAPSNVSDREITAVSGVSFVALGDVDGDGDLDLLGSGSGGTAVRFNNGSGGFNAPGGTTVAGATGLPVLTDVDNDGDLDLTTNAGGTTVEVRRNQATAPTLTSLSPNSAAVGASITLTGTNFTGATGVSFNGTAAVTFSVTNATTATAIVPAGVSSGNVTITTPDGTSNGVNFTVEVLTITALSPARNLRNAATASNVAVTLSQPLQNTAATQGAVKVFSQQRGGRMSGPQGGAATVSGATITFNPTNDFRPGETLYVTTTTAATGTTGATLARGHVHQLTAAVGGTGTGLFDAPISIPAGNPTTGLAVGDLNNDGRPDLITTNYSNTTVSVALATGPTTYAPATTTPVAGGALAVSLADFDGDGDLDFVTANFTSSNLSIGLNDGAGTFAVSNVATANAPRWVAPADVDGDGDLDLLASLNNGVQIFANNGSGAFALLSTVSGINFASALVVADVDGDGDLDLLAASSAQSDAVSVRLNDGAGTFTGTQQVAVGRQPEHLAVGDVDGDGDLDLVTANESAGTVSVRLNTNGTFAPPSNVIDREIAVVGNANVVALGDVDGDGDLDLVAASNAGTAVRFNNGSGGFNAPGSTTTTTSAVFLALADLDNDGDLDMATSTGLTTLRVRLNQAPAPTLTSLSPTSGPVGTSVTLTGTNLTGTTGVSFNGTAASTFSVTTATTATATVPAGATSGNVTITTPSGTSNGVAFTVITNQAPTAIGLSPQSVAENVSGGTIVGNFSTTDPDAGNTFTYTLVTGSGATDNSAFSIIGELLVVMVSPNFEVKPSYAIRVRATDQGGLFVEQTFTITVTDENDQPSTLTDTNPAANAVPENAAPGTSVGMTFFATDPDAGAALTYSLPNSDGGRFQIDGATGVVTVLDGTLLNYEAATQHTIEVQVSDGSFSNSQSFIIAVTNVNEAPVVSPATFGLTENSANGTVVGTVAATDPDAGTTLTYSITAGNTGGAFSFVGNQLTVANSTALDFETTPAFSLTVQVSDGSLTSAATVTVNLTDVAEDLVVSSPQNIPAGTWRNVTVMAGGIAILNGNLTVTGTLLVQAGGVLQTRARQAQGGGCYVISGPGSFVLAAGGQISVCDAQGISLSGATGTVQVTGTRTFSPHADYLYDGTGSQLTGSGLPARARTFYKFGAGTLVLSQAVAVRQAVGLLGPTGNIALNGQTLTLRSDADTTAYADNSNGGAVLGNTAVVQRYIPAVPATASYHHLASPVQAAPVSDLTTTGFTAKVNPAYNAIPTPTLSTANFPTVFAFDEARGGAANPNFSLGYASPSSLSTVLAPGRGYSVLIPGAKTPDFVGTLTTGNVTVSNLTATGDPATNGKAGWQLLGNPYPQPIDWDLATIPAGLDPTIYVWIPTGGANGFYRVRNGATGVGNLTNGVLALGQAFFARVTSTSPVSFAFTNALRVADNTVALSRSVTSTAPLLRLNLTQAGASINPADATFLTTAPTASLAFDAGLDALRPGRNAGVPTLATRIGGQEAAINTLPTAALTSSTETVVELTAVLPAIGAYTLSVGELTNFGATSVELLDRLTNTRYDLATLPTLALRATRADEEVTGRFALVLNGQRVTGVAALAADAVALAVYPNPASGADAVRVTGCRAGSPVAVFDVAGRRVATGVADASGEAELKVRGLAAGVYSVRVSDGRTARLVIE